MAPQHSGAMSYCSAFLVVKGVSQSTCGKVSLFSNQQQLVAVTWQLRRSASLIDFTHFFLPIGFFVFLMNFKNSLYILDMFCY